MSVPLEKRQAVEKLIKYMDLFSSPQARELCLWTEEKDEEGNTFRVPTYKDELFDFIEEAYNSGILEPDYINIMNSLSGGENELDAIIYALPSSDYLMCAAVLTCIVRQERFSPGLWGIACKEKWFLAVLSRMEILLDE